MSGNSLGAVTSGALAGAERSGGGRNEPQRSGAAAKAGADPVLASRPDPEVAAKPKRRTFTAEYKLGILQEAEAPIRHRGEAVAGTRGGIGSLLRREGLYSSLLATWWRERANGILEALTPQKRGPKSKRNPMEEEENQKLRRRNARLASARAPGKRERLNVCRQDSISRGRNRIMNLERFDHRQLAISLGVSP